MPRHEIDIKLLIMRILLSLSNSLRFSSIQQFCFLAFDSRYKSTTLDSRSCFNLFMDSQQWPLGHFDVTTLDRTGKAESSSNQEEQKDLITSNIWNTRLAVNRQMLHIMQPHTHVTIHTWTMGWWKGLEVLWDLLMWKQMNRSILTTCRRNTFFLPADVG